MSRSHRVRSISKLSGNVLFHPLFNSVRPFKYRSFRNDDEKNSKEIGLFSFPLKFGDIKLEIIT